MDKITDLLRSSVRVGVTYLATFYTFGVGSALILFPSITCDFDKSKELYLAILPIATGIITYWFATRPQNLPPSSTTSNNAPNNTNKPSQ